MSRTPISYDVFLASRIVSDKPEVFVELLLQVIEDRMRLRQQRVRQRDRIDAPPVRDNNIHNKLL